MTFAHVYNEIQNERNTSDWYRTDSTDSPTIERFYSAQRLDLFAWCVRLSRLLVGFERT